MRFFWSGSMIVTLAALREAAAAFAVEATNQSEPCKLRIIRVFWFVLISFAHRGVASAAHARKISNVQVAGVTADTDNLGLVGPSR
jgi:hypothetical protein